MNEKQQVELFMKYQKKSEDELRQLLQSRGLKPADEKIRMIQQAVKSTPTETTEPTDFPQAFAIKMLSEDDRQWMRNLNARILPANANGTLNKKQMRKKKFNFWRQDGSSYVLSCPYIVASPREVGDAIFRGVISSLSNQKKLIQEMNKDTTKYDMYWVRKRDANSRWYTMLYVAGEKQ